MGSYALSRSETIAAPPERIRPLIARFPEWRTWSPFENTDPELSREYRGAEEGTGAVYEWSGNKQAGAGIMTITDTTDDQVKIHLQFLRPFKAESRHTFDLAPSGGGATTVTWTMTGEQKGLMGLLMKLFLPMEKAMGPQFERGLATLKEVAES